MKNLSRERVREIVLAEIDLFSKRALKNEDTGALSERLGTLEFLTREDVYNASPNEVEKLINTNFKEIISVNSIVSMTALMAVNSMQDDPVDINNLSPEDAEGYQVLKDFADFSAKYPEAVGLDGKSTNALQALQDAMNSGDMSTAGDILPELMMHMDGGIHSCVRVHIEDVDEAAGEVIFDFVNEDAQEEFCDFLKIPKKTESMIRIHDCDFDDDYPKKGEFYDLNIVEMQDVDFEEVTDSATIGISMDGSDLCGSSPFYADDEDDEGEIFPSDVDGAFVVILEGVPAMVASGGGRYPKEYLNPNGSLNQDILEKIGNSLERLPVLNREDEVEFNEDYIRERLKGQTFATPETYKKAFIDGARLGFVTFDCDPEDDCGKFVWVARPKRLASLTSFSDLTLKVEEDGEKIDSFFISDEGDIIPN